MISPGVQLVLACTVLVGSSAIPPISDKDRLVEEMLDIGRRVLVLKERGAPASSVDSLTREYQDLSDALGGDDPAALLPIQPIRYASGGDAAPVIFGASPPGTTFTTTNYSATGPNAITDLATTTSTITVVANPDTYIWDLDLRAFITHTFNGDLDITLTSPAGTVVTVTTDNAGTNDNVFNGTPGTTRRPSR